LIRWVDARRHAVERIGQPAEFVVGVRQLHGEIAASDFWIASTSRTMGFESHDDMGIIQPYAHRQQAYRQQQRRMPYAVRGALRYHPKRAPR
jgi:hypothetical protein